MAGGALHAGGSSGARVRRRHHVSFAGAAFAAVTFFLGAGALNSQNNLLFVAFGAALGTIIVSGIVSGAMLMGADVRRVEVEPAEAGRALRVRYEVTCRNRLVPGFALRIEERRVEGGDGPARIGAVEAFAPYVPTRGRVVVEGAGPALRRGVVRLGAVRVASSFPFGVMAKSVERRESAEALVRPEAVECDVDLAALVSRARREAAATSRAGQSAEFLSLREYAPGDSVRRIAWRATARRGEPVVREHADPGESAVWVAVDLAGGDESAQEMALSLAAGLIRRAAREGLDVGLSAPAAGLWRAPAAERGARARRSFAVEAMLDELARVDLGALRDHARSRPLPAGDAVVVVHAGGGDERGWPAGAAHVRAADYLAAGEAGP